jgi:hypothetical protein
VPSVPCNSINWVAAEVALDFGHQALLAVPNRRPPLIIPTLPAFDAVKVPMLARGIGVPQHHSQRHLFEEPLGWPGLERRRRFLIFPYKNILNIIKELQNNCSDFKKLILIQIHLIDLFFYNSVRLQPKRYAIRKTKVSFKN